MITQTVKASEASLTVDMKGVDFKDMVVQRMDGNINRLTFTAAGFALMKEAFSKGEASVSTGTKKLSKKVEEKPEEILEEAKETVASEKVTAEMAKDNGKAGTSKGAAKGKGSKSAAKK